MGRQGKGAFKDINPAELLTDFCEDYSGPANLPLKEAVQRLLEWNEIRRPTKTFVGKVRDVFQEERDISRYYPETETVTLIPALFKHQDAVLRPSAAELAGGYLFVGDRLVPYVDPLLGVDSLTLKLEDGSTIGLTERELPWPEVYQWYRMVKYDMLSALVEPEILDPEIQDAFLGGEMDMSADESVECLVLDMAPVYEAFDMKPGDTLRCRLESFMYGSFTLRKGPRVDLQQPSDEVVSFVHAMDKAVVPILQDIPMSFSYGAALFLLAAFAENPDLVARAVIDLHGYVEVSDKVTLVDEPLAGPFLTLRDYVEPPK